MERRQFRESVNEILKEIGSETLSYDESEFWMIQPLYEYIEYYAIENGLLNTAIALPLARGVHNGAHRKLSVEKNGNFYRLPYMIHCLSVCRLLADIPMSLTREEKDILLAAALSHDMIEDVPFPDHGRELYTKFHLDSRVYEIVRRVSKRKDFTEEEERAHFHGIESDRLALMVKLSDRGNNVEDLYNMPAWKIHEYVGETKKFFLSMCEYGIQHYPELVTTIEILQDKIITLINSAEILINRYEAREQELNDQLHALQEENRQLRKIWKEIWGE